MKLISRISFLLLGLLILKETTAKSLKPKIFGGRDTNITEVPWQLLQYVDGNQACGGIVIGPREVLTAGHCFQNVDLSQNFVQYRAGSDQLYSGGKNYTVEYFVMHPEYNITDDFIYHDITFARVKEPFEFSESVQPIKLARSEPKNGEEALISGFGLSLRNEDPNNITVDYPDVLQSVVLPAVDRETCREWYSDFYWEVRDDQICAGKLEGGVGGCSGDSGGPMVVNNELVGITSWADPCAKPHHPTVYTSVPYYIDWIEEQLNA